MITTAITVKIMTRLGIDDSRAGMAKRSSVGWPQ
jgi:hypothetical protein